VLEMSKIIDGKAIASKLRAQIALQVDELYENYQFKPGLAVVLVGENPASQIYVRNKARMTEAVGMASFSYILDRNGSENELLDLIDRLNARDDVHGILVQLPLPDHINTGNIIESIDPAKDVDGFHPLNVGRIASGQKALVPCTPLGCSILVKSVTPDLAGSYAVVIGRSNIVGKPVSQLLLQENCTVTIAHSRTRNLDQVTASADIVIAAVGRPELVKANWIKPGAIVIDVGINRIPAPEIGADKTRLVGDVDFADVSPIAGAITPVPGGVGPMTIACLLRNTLQAAMESRLGYSPSLSCNP